jgi:hypothetical protein
MEIIILFVFLFRRHFYIQEKAKIQKDLSILTDRLSKINEALARKVQARNEYDKTIQETEAAYMKILESSQTLLHVLKVRYSCGCHAFLLVGWLWDGFCSRGGLFVIITA